MISKTSQDRPQTGTILPSFSEKNIDQNTKLPFQGLTANNHSSRTPLLIDQRDQNNTYEFIYHKFPGCPERDWPVKENKLDH
jgi:hypothetical protein